MNHLSHWMEIPAKDLKRAQIFYEKVLQIELAPIDLGPIHYALFPTEDRFNAGALTQGDGDQPSAQDLPQPRGRIYRVVSRSGRQSYRTAAKVRGLGPRYRFGQASITERLRHRP
jgi:hypothetical protein